MLNLVIAVVVILSSIWVYVDATEHKIGKIRGQGGFYNMSAGAWVVTLIGIWIIAFPSYLFKRRSLIRLAQQYPVTTRCRPLKTVLLVAAGMIWLSLCPPVRLKSDLPACDSDWVVSLALDAAKDLPAVNDLGIQINQLVYPGEKAYEPHSDIRICRAFLLTSKGKLNMTYSVEWHNKKRGYVWVEILPE